MQTLYPVRTPPAENVSAHAIASAATGQGACPVKQQILLNRAVAFQRIATLFFMRYQAGQKP
jgi:hypothetical protein